MARVSPRVADRRPLVGLTGRPGFGWGGTEVAHRIGGCGARRYFTSVVYMFFPEWFALTESHYSALRSLVYFNAVVLLVIAAGLFIVHRPSLSVTPFASAKAAPACGRECFGR